MKIKITIIIIVMVFSSIVFWSINKKDGYVYGGYLIPSSSGVYSSKSFGAIVDGEHSYFSMHKSVKKVEDMARVYDKLNKDYELGDLCFAGEKHSSIVNTVVLDGENYQKILLFLEGYMVDASARIDGVNGKYVDELKGFMCEEIKKISAE